MENGSYMPNTAVSLLLARVLDTKVEELFSLGEDSSSSELPSEQAMLLPGGDLPKTGQPVQLCRVNGRLMALCSAPAPWYLPSSDAIVASKPALHRKTKVEVFRTDQDFRNRILIGGCDPAISVLARHAEAAGVELVLAHRNSSAALELLKEGNLHIAGTHLRDDASGESNLPAVGRLFPRNSVAVVSFATWEEGIVTAYGNPKHIHGIEDFARPEVRIVNRETGAGSRLLLDSRLSQLGISSQLVQGYEEFAPGHLAAAWQVRSGHADSCIATRAAARILGLHFIPLVSERYDFVLRRQHLEHPKIQVLLDVLNRFAFRRELETVGGYETKHTGQQML